MHESADPAELLTARDENSWPLLQNSLAGVDRIPSSKLGRWMKSAVVRLALVWLSISIGLVMLQMARDAMLKSWRRESAAVAPVPQGEEV